MNFNFDTFFKGFIVIIGIFIVLLTFSKITEEFQSNHINMLNRPNSQLNNFKINWHISPSQYLPQMIQEFGIPDIIDTNQGGLALWKQSTLSQRGYCWDQIIIRDAEKNFVIVKYQFPLARLHGQLDLDEAISDLRKFSNLATYDLSDQVIIVKGDSIQHNIVLLTLIKRFLSREITVLLAQDMLLPLLLSIEPKSKDYDINTYTRLKLELCTYLSLQLSNNRS